MSLQQEVVLLREQVAQLLAINTQLRQQIDRQQVQIDRLIKIAFGHKSERVEGPTLFDDLLDDPIPSDTPLSPEPTESMVLVHRVKQSFVIHADDSPVTLLRPNRTAYAWLYLGDASQPYTVFDLTAGRGEEHPTRFLSGYHGFLQADGYAGYNAVHGHERQLGCWPRSASGSRRNTGQCCPRVPWARRSATPGTSGPRWIVTSQMLASPSTTTWPNERSDRWRWAARTGCSSVAKVACPRPACC